MVAVVVGEMLGQQATNIGLADVEHIESIYFSQIKLYLSWWDMNGVGIN